MTRKIFKIRVYINETENKLIKRGKNIREGEEELENKKRNIKEIG